MYKYQYIFENTAFVYNLHPPTAAGAPVKKAAAPVKKAVAQVTKVAAAPAKKAAASSSSEDSSDSEDEATTKAPVKVNYQIVQICLKADG